MAQAQLAHQHSQLQQPVLHIAVGAAAKRTVIAAWAVDATASQVVVAAVASATVLPGTRVNCPGWRLAGVHLVCPNRLEVGAAAYGP